MRYPIRMTFTDRDCVLSAVDVHQVENMLWLGLAPAKEKVKWVKLEISRLDHDRYGSGHMVQIATKLKSGIVVESCTARVSKGAALMASVDHMQDLVEQRLRFESTWFYRSTRSIKTMLRGLMGSSGSDFQVAGNNCSSSAT